MIWPSRNWGVAIKTATTLARKEGEVALFVATILYAVVGLIAIWWSIFAKVPGLTMGIFVVFLVGAIVLVVVAKVVSARQRY